MKISQYIESGILESYVLGSTSEAETRELLQLKKQHPEIQHALYDLEIDMEGIALQMAITPPPHLWQKIDDSINELIAAPQTDTLSLEEYRKKEYTGYRTHTDNNQFINVESESTHMRVHKSWKWVLAAVFVLGKIFLGCAIYFYLENRQAQQQILDLKAGLQQHTTR